MIKFINVAVAILLTNNFIYIYPISLVYITSYQDSLGIIIYDHSKYTPVSTVSMREFIQRISPVSMQMSIHVNNEQCYVKLRVLPFKYI